MSTAVRSRGPCASVLLATVWVAALLGAPPPATAAAQDSDAVSLSGPVVLYEFLEGAGSSVGDSSGVGDPLDLTIADVGAVAWGPGGLTVSSAVVSSQGPPTKLLDAVVATQELTVEAWVVPANVTQDGPARIVSNAMTPHARNFMLGQGMYGKHPDDVFSMRFRTSSTVSGTPELRTAAGTASTALTHVVMTRAVDGTQRIYLDGAVQAAMVVEGDLSAWDRSFPLVLGNIGDGTRPWAGTLCRVALYDRALSAQEVSDGHVAGCRSGTAMNRAPVLDPVGDQVSVTGSSVSLQVSATDADGDPLSFAATGLPAGLAIDAATGRISGTPTTAGSSTVTISVDDSQATDSETLTWTVQDNDAPQALDDAYDLDEDATLAVGAAAGVLSNDSDPDGDELRAALVDDVSHGTLALAADGSFEYVPHPDFSGADQFTYRASDGSLESVVATVALTVHALADAPVAVDDAYSTAADTPLSVTAAEGVLANDTDGDGDVLLAILVEDVAHGSLALRGDGSFDYVPVAGFTGDDGFGYRVSDGSSESLVARVQIVVGSDDLPPRFVTGGVGVAKQVIDATVDQTHDVVGADLDGDGDIDLAATDFVDDTVHWYESTGSGTYLRHDVDTSLDGAYPLHSDDVDGDGDVDLLATGYLGDTVAWYENDGRGQFTRRAVDTAADGAHSVVTVDLDRDGDLDLVTTEQDAGAVRWYENDGAQSFRRWTVDAAATAAKYAVAADMDGDADLDLVAASNGLNEVAWYENDGAQAFVKRQIDGAAKGAYYVSVADLDRDGDIDVLAASQRDDTVAWHRNDGTGAFTKHVLDRSADGARTVIVADLDGDGDPDALAASADDDTVSWFDNDGTGRFTGRILDGAADGAYGIDAVDVDLDGDLDVLSASRDADAVAIQYQHREHETWLSAGRSVLISTDLLQVTDPDDAAPALLYTVTSAPVHGELRLDGHALSAGQTFTQQDVDTGLLSYVHTGAAGLADEVWFDVSDGGQRQSLVGSFRFLIHSPDDVVTHLGLDEGTGSTAFDSGPRGNHGTLVGGATYGVGSPDGSPFALRLDGVDDHVSLGPLDVTGTGLTLAGWFNADTFPGSGRDPRIIAKATSVATNDHVFMLSTTASGSATRLRVRVKTNGLATTLIAAAGDLQVGTWYHAAATYDGAVLRLFLDGDEVGSVPLAGPVDTAPDVPVAVGAQPEGAGGRFFDGLLDDIRILQRPLAPHEVAGLAGRA